MTRPGERQTERGKEFKDNTGSSPNGVANSWLAKQKGQQVHVHKDGGLLCMGTLIGFDAYSILIRERELERLVFKGPGVVLIADAES